MAMWSKVLPLTASCPSSDINQSSYERIKGLANTKLCKEHEKSLKPWHMGTHLKVHGECYPMITNMTGFKWVSKCCILVLWTKVALACIGRVKRALVLLLKSGHYSVIGKRSLAQEQGDFSQLCRQLAIGQEDPRFNSK